ncbi:hypothetical protein COCSUDRAFT_57045 [Coccomyxa subellipsoidea C-169]|uniref:SS18 N-terminal domain-containing protein n=1 Tax=Coccomyxa subellipsoidea (strain C-169) TaxID=574566 RepID=I0YRV6_COCSC|nr:hypothetical protein COCSUDRAFT_57045 [Coccomyxa subellipsoidea C-169]EIE21125.1 hypothetical protein COCSUDRAFT_57045 [Coccomyxa subellipsoidea C-169]|eukprot:XP_005645669.1 hypothetical protein COCSUDRAFT_57045 [Coccomyxa subellipsoidea C-169]
MCTVQAQDPGSKPPTLLPGALNAQAPTSETVQKYLEDNESLIKTILECINSGRADEAVKYQQRLQANLMWLAGIADSQAPPTPAASAPAPGTQVPAAPGQAAPVAAGQQLVQAADTVMKTAQEAAAQQAPPQQAG